MKKNTQQSSKRNFFRFMFLIAFMGMSFSSFAATTFYVRSTGNDVNDGTSTGTAVLTLSAALDKVTTDGDIIDVAGTVNFFPVGATATKIIIKNITIQGSGASTTLINGTGSTSLLKPAMLIGDAVGGATVTVQSLTFQDFNGTTPTVASGRGGSVFSVEGGSLSCSNVVFQNNKAFQGGAIYFNSKASAISLSFVDCYFYNNQAIKFTGYTSAMGGAIFGSSANLGDVNSSITINRCLFESNTSEHNGSAFRYSTGLVNGVNKQSVSIVNSTFTKNIVNYNTSATGYGVIHFDSPSSGTSTKNYEISLINNTIAYNSTTQTDQYGTAGVFFNNVYLDNTITLINNILYSNKNSHANQTSVSINKTPNNNTFKFKELRNNLSDWLGAFSSTNSVANIDYAYAASGNASTGSNLSLAASTALANNGGATKTLALGAGSTAINAGYTTGAPTVDQRNVARVGNPDVGAYENTLSTTVVLPADGKISYKQLNGTVVFSNLTDFNNLKVYSSNGVQITDQKLFGNSFELKTKTGLYVVHLLAKDGANYSLKLSVK